MKRSRLLLLVTLLSTAGAPAYADALRDCLESAGDIAPHTEALAREIQRSLTRDGFLHRGYLSPTELRMYDNRKLAEMLVARLDNECEKPRTPAASETVDSEIVMMVRGEHFDSIAKLGFLNQHMTGTTGGCNCAFDRFRQEQSMITLQTPYSHKMRELLPKYSAFNLKSKGFGEFYLPSMYGNIAVVMKPEVKKRMTFTFEDSLGWNFGKGEEHFPPRTAGYKKPKDGRALPECNGYCEAQIWGPLDFGDVAHIMVHKGEDIPDSIKKLGIPVYEFEHSDNTIKGQAAQYKKGKLLLAGKKASPRAPANPSRKEIEAELAAAAEGPLKNLYESRLLGKMSETELLAKFEASRATASEEDRWTDVAVSKTARIFSELASRPLSPAIEKVLLANRDHKSSLIRHQALLGLSALPLDRLKPILIETLRFKDNTLQALAVAIAADFPNDKELAEEVRRAIEPDEYVNGEDMELKKFAARLAQGKFCSPLGVSKKKKKKSDSDSDS